MLLEATPVNLLVPLGARLLLQVAPLSDEVKIKPLLSPLEATATSFTPSLLEAMASQLRTAPPTRRAVHVDPESVEVQISPPRSTAATFVPSIFDAMKNQFRPDVFGIMLHVAPKSVER